MNRIKVLMAFCLLWTQGMAQQADAEFDSIVQYDLNSIYVVLENGYDLGAVVDNDINNLLGDFSWIQEKFNSGEFISMSQEFKVLAKENDEFARIYRVTLNSNINSDELIGKIKFAFGIDFCEKIPLYKLDYSPSDPDYATGSKRWHLDQINAEAAWDVTTGNSNITIAIVDDAILTSHEDLQANIYVNSGEILNGLDDDGNGYIDDISGYDVADMDNDPNPPVNVTINQFSHGTHVSGIASGSTDNSFGTASIGFNTSIIPVKVMPIQTDIWIMQFKESSMLLPVVLT